MKKLSVGQAASEIAKKSFTTAKNAAKASAKHAMHAGTSAFRLEIPDSLNWIFGFGFKVGVFLILKSFLILRSQWSNLQLFGFMIIFTQLLQGLTLVSCGALMQNKNLYDSPLKLRKVTKYYGYVFLIGLLLFMSREAFGWNFFKEPKAVNWFIDFFAAMTKGISEISLSILFWDFDLWSLFCGILYFMTATYLHVSFNYQDGIMAKFFRNARLTDHSRYTKSLSEPENPNQISES